MTSYIETAFPITAITQLTPGHLLASFGWAADAIASMIEVEPTLLIPLFELDRARMHLIALALAHLNEASPAIGAFLFTGSVRTVTEHTLGHHPTGIKRALGQLPSIVLTPESYRRLVELIADPTTAKLFHHASSIDGSMIKALYGLPAPLRRSFLLPALDCFDRDNGFTDGLRLLVSRGAAPNFETLISELASASQPNQFFAKLKYFVESLPWSNVLPPSQIGKARRIDQADTIRSLAKSWHNCLASYVPKIDAGTCAVYLWEDGSTSAACSVHMRGRLGWFLDDVKGPRNAEIAPNPLAKIKSAFEQAGIPSASIVIAILMMIDKVEPEELARRIRGRAIAEANHAQDWP